MNECEFSNQCPFFNNKSENMGADAESVKNSYCRGNNLHCALYMIASSLGTDKMPTNVLPAEKEKAFAIIAG
ncbi:MAG TPA: hypothetical protein PLB48_11250 [Treponema sp.]|nr:hypothetical protein [Treponema sp.]